MSDRPLNFDPSSLGSFDAAHDPADALAGFDSADGVTTVPPGMYRCQLQSGELVTTKTGKSAYRLRFVVDEPEKHAGFQLLRYFVLNDPANANRAKAALAPLGLKSSADLKQFPFPQPGRTIICKLLVGVQKNDPTMNDVLRFSIESDTAGTAPTNPYAVPLDGGQEGVPQQ